MLLEITSQCCGLRFESTTLGGFYMYSTLFKHSDSNTNTKIMLKSRRQIFDEWGGGGLQGRNPTNLPISLPLEEPMIMPRPYQSRKVEKDQQSVDDKAGYINVKAGFLRTVSKSCVLCAIIGSSVLSLQKSFTNMREARFPVREIISGSLLTTQPGWEGTSYP